MTGLPLLVTFLLATPSADLTDSFRRGVEQRGNQAEARKQFREAAKQCDDTWRTGTQSVELAILRSRSHYLAGNLPSALASLHEAMALGPTDYQLHRELAALRETIRYPEPVDPRLRVRPDSLPRFWQLLSPWELFGLAAVGAVLVLLGLVGWFTTRPRWAFRGLLVGLLVFLACGWFSLRIAILRPDPVIILTRDTMLRTGNGDSYPPRMFDTLPRGTELRELARRGGWIQVELTGGAAGWIPEVNGASGNKP